MQHSITHRTPFCPTFAENRQPSPDALIWRINLSAPRAFQLLCDIEAAYANPGHVPRVGGMLEENGSWSLYVWPRVDPDSQLLMLMITKYGGVRMADASRWEGQAWVSEPLLGKILAAIATRTYWDLTEPQLLADARPGYMLGLERQVAK